MVVSNQAPESKFVYVVVAARRARQLMTGAQPLLDRPRSHKATRIAMEELEKTLLEYELPDSPGEAAEKEGKRRKA